MKNSSRPALLRRGIRLEAVVIVWNVIEGIVAIVAGVAAGSVALFGFGVDSLIEVTSAAIVLRRLSIEVRGGSSERTEALERRAERIAGALLLFLAAYIAVDATRKLVGYGTPSQESLVGVALTGLSLIVMPILGWAKLRTADSLDSRALRADSFETIACAWLSLTTLIGLTANVLWGWTWADPLAALVIVPLIVREGWEGWRGEDRHQGDDDTSDGCGD